MKEKISKVLLIIWTVIAVVLLVTIALTDRLGWSRTVVTNIVWVYAIGSFVVGVVRYLLRRK